MKLKYLTLVSLIFIVACQESDPTERAAFAIAADDTLELTAFDGDVAYEFEVPDTHQAQPLMSQDQRLIKDGTIEFESKNLGKTISLIKTQTQHMGGYIGGESAYDYEDKLVNSLTIRIPVNQFDSFIQSISEGVKHFDRKDINTRDITEEFIDLASRISSKKKLEQRYLELAEKADSVKDMLSIEEQVGKIREEIESMEGSLNFLDNRSSMSMLHIMVYQIKTDAIMKPDTFGTRLLAGLSSGVNIIKGLIITLVSIWPLLILAFGAWLLFKNRLKKKNLNETVLN